MNKGCKACTKCGAFKDLECFNSDCTKKDGRASRCKKCLAERRKGNTTKVNRLCKYGLTQKQFEEKFRNQGSVCAACKSSTTRLKWCIDHNHACCPGAVTCGKCVRGILCYSCNIILGHCSENTDYLQGLIDYLGEYGTI